VKLLTSRFVHGPAPVPEGYERAETFYPVAARLAAGAPRARRALRIAEHVPGMLRARRLAREADLVHLQWLPVERVDARLLPRGRPLVFTMHNVIRRESIDSRIAGRMDAVIVHTRHGAELLGGGERVHVIPHGAFEHLTRQPREEPLPPKLAAVDGPVTLFLGVIRDYKGVDVLLEAFAAVPAGELWVVGRPLGVSMERLRRLAPAGRVRFVSRYVRDTELPALLRRADVLVLPHRRVDVSGVLFAGLAFGKAMVLSDVGGFRELVEDHGAGLLVPPGEPAALAEALSGLLCDESARRRLAERASAAAAGPLSWERVAERTRELYEEVLA
jgi:glycosyltransferase involved in cell wall biosynthesis